MVYRTIVVDAFEDDERRQDKRERERQRRGRKKDARKKSMARERESEGGKEKENRPSSW